MSIFSELLQKKRVNEMFDCIYQHDLETFKKYRDKYGIDLDTPRTCKVPNRTRWTVLSGVEYFLSVSARTKTWNIFEFLLREGASPYVGDVLTERLPEYLVYEIMDQQQKGHIPQDLLLGMSAQYPLLHTMALLQLKRDNTQGQDVVNNRAVLDVQGNGTRSQKVRAILEWAKNESCFLLKQDINNGVERDTMTVLTSKKKKI